MNENLIIINFLFLFLIFGVTFYEDRENKDGSRILGSILIRASLVSLIIHFYNGDHKWTICLATAMADPAFIISLSKDLMMILKENLLKKGRR